MKLDDKGAKERSKDTKEPSESAVHSSPMTKNRSASTHTPPSSDESERNHTNKRYSSSSSSTYVRHTPKSQNQHFPNATGYKYDRSKHFNNGDGGVYKNIGKSTRRPYLRKEHCSRYQSGNCRRDRTCEYLHINPETKRDVRFPEVHFDDKTRTLKICDETSAVQQQTPPPPPPPSSESSIPQAILPVTVPVQESQKKEIIDETAKNVQKKQVVSLPPPPPPPTKMEINTVPLSIETKRDTNLGVSSNNAVHNNDCNNDDEDDRFSFDGDGGQAMDQEMDQNDTFTTRNYEYRTAKPNCSTKSGFNSSPSLSPLRNDGSRIQKPQDTRNRRSFIMSRLMHYMSELAALDQYEGH